MTPYKITLSIEYIDMFVFRAYDNLLIAISIHISDTEREQAMLKGSPPFFLERASRMCHILNIIEGYQVLAVSRHENLDIAILINIRSEDRVNWVVHRILRYEFSALI